MSCRRGSSFRVDAWLNALRGDFLGKAVRRDRLSEQILAWKAGRIIGASSGDVRDLVRDV